MADAEVRLRPVRITDIDTFHDHEQEPEAQRRANFEARERPEFVTHWITRILGDPAVGARTVLVGDAVAGNVVSWNQNGRREVGYWLGRAFWGRGVGTRALTQYLDIETARPLHATADVGNTASIRLLERCGFARIDTVREGAAEFAVLELP
ncbi:GNAT family N-acetyltransferase [Paractinoplanes hotanensis]|uniref:GNAT family N-acetyltransferase n=1 Tax=Paractinoplanes hotanensis TaxID=2906497 RepID=A0ABT0Y2H4_9ACTN|nr:GNAT family N-acetyltransferase [Actinoplanes hotanensis]MCM4080233.1 GNAT family N-acetyltransferase [Actinoplanes hotanensis]